MSGLRLIHVTNPEAPRTAAFAAAAVAQTGVEPAVLPWLEVLTQGVMPLDQTGPTFIRIDSPGKNWQVEKRLLELGAFEADEEDPERRRWRRLPNPMCQNLQDDPGRIQPSRQWYLGFRLALAKLEFAGSLAESGWFQRPDDILKMFDKAACQKLLEEGGCNVAQQLGIPEGFDDLMERMRECGRQRIFLKLCHGSSASGAVALERSGSRIQAWSTAEVDLNEPNDIVLYNSRRLRRYDAQEVVRLLVDAVCRERAMAEAWIPKAGWQGKRFDVRVVVIGGQARHLVARLAAGPFTNLQVGARRGSAEALREFAGPAAYDSVVTAAEQAMACFPDSLFGAVDVALEVGMRRAYVLEVNAFGDYLPGLLLEGRDTYAWELAEVVKASGQPTGIRSGKPCP